MNVYSPDNISGKPITVKVLLIRETASQALLIAVNTNEYKNRVLTFELTKKMCNKNTQHGIL